MLQLLVLVVGMLVVGVLTIRMNASLELHNHNNTKTTKSTTTTDLRNSHHTTGINNNQTSPSISSIFDTNGRYGVVGILSSALGSEYQALRTAQRATWVKDARLYYNIRVYFLIDNPTAGPSELDTEQKLFNDIVYINATYSGRAVRFGEKLANWYKIVSAMHPDAAFVAKVDDDCVVCSSVMWPFIWQHVVPTSYIGWMHQYDDYTNKVAAGSTPIKLGGAVRMDEFFVVVGMDLVHRISKRKYCHDRRGTQCNRTADLYDTNYGGTSLGEWLGAYNNDVHITTLNMLSMHATKQFPLKKRWMYGTPPLQYTCPHYAMVHPIKSPMAFLPVYNQST